MLEQDEHNFYSSIVPRNRKRTGFFSEVQFAEVPRAGKHAPEAGWSVTRLARLRGERNLGVPSVSAQILTCALRRQEW